MGTDLEVVVHEGERPRGPTDAPNHGDSFFQPGIGLWIFDGAKREWLMQQETEWKKIATAKAAVWTLLSDEKWHTTMEINAVDVGGSEGCRRLRELRQKVRKGKYPPYNDIGAARIGGETTQWKYRLVRAAPWES